MSADQQCIVIQPRQGPEYSFCDQKVCEKYDAWRDDLLVEPVFKRKILPELGMGIMRHIQYGVVVKSVGRKIYLNSIE